LIIGIDPGLKGGIALINNDGRVKQYHKMPVIEFKNTKGKRVKKTIIDIYKVNEIIQKEIVKDEYSYSEFTHVFLERASAMPASQNGESTQGTASMFNYGREYGKLFGMLSVIGIEFSEVIPRVWKKHFNLSKDKSEAKNLAVRLSGCNFILPRCRVPHEGICEAYLIALYGLQINSNE
jgi:hypothetical protein